MDIYSVTKDTWLIVIAWNNTIHQRSYNTNNLRLVVRIYIRRGVEYCDFKLPDAYFPR